MAEDHAIMRRGLCALLHLTGQFQVVGQARNGREAVELAATLLPDVILMDISMPELNGLEAAKQILSANPASRVIMLSAHTDEMYVRLAIVNGARGFIEKQVVSKYLTQAITEVVLGGTFYSPGIARCLR